MAKAEQTREALEEMNPDVLYADGFDDALIGVARQFTKHLAVYDYELCVEVLTRRGMTVEQAVEYMEFNVVGAYVGPNTPIFLHTKFA